MTHSYVARLVGEIRIGTRRDKVIEFLNKHGVENSDHYPGGPPNEVYAIFHRVESRDWIVERSVAVVFVFRNDKLVRQTMKDVYTGP